MNLAGLDFIGKPRLRAPPMGHREQPVLEVPFKDGPSRLRRGQGAKNIALVRPFAINFRPAATAKRSIKLGRKQAGWDPRAMPASTRNQTTDQRQITTAENKSKKRPPALPQAAQV